MTSIPKPGNEPEPDDMADAFAIDGDVTPAKTTNLTEQEEEEEQAARLGDFA